jgi:hypothetical protein
MIWLILWGIAPVLTRLYQPQACSRQFFFSRQSSQKPLRRFFFRKSCTFSEFVILSSFLTEGSRIRSRLKRARPVLQHRAQHWPRS